MVEANCPDNEPSGLDETGKGHIKSQNHSISARYTVVEA